MRVEIYFLPPANGMRGWTYKSYSRMIFAGGRDMHLLQNWLEKECEKQIGKCEKQKREWYNWLEKEREKQREKCEENERERKKCTYESEFTPVNYIRGEDLYMWMSFTCDVFYVHPRIAFTSR